MRLHLLAVGTRMPAWVESGFKEYAKRLPADCALILHEITPGKRGKGADLARAQREEGERMLVALPKGAYIVALEVDGQDWSTEDLAQRLGQWRQQGGDVVLLVGGPEGLAASCRERADVSWSLSRLTLPHPLVRIVLAEQMYRAWSILQGHPYHR
ncbi:MAG: 23S rRNA (pseudouridine(1915)-N(3))-methyltransferase RlmH [Thiohalomonadaceae bacterium]